MSNDEGEREKERELRNRILRSPSLLPGFDEPVAAAREVPVRRAGSADVVVVDAEGQIAIVECKRARNPESRRSVIGQVFEYAAGLWKLDYTDLERILAARGTELTKPFERVAGWDEPTFGRDLSRNLEAGDFRLFIAVDEMTERLKKRLNRTVTFLNSQLPKVEFLAVALPRDGPEEVYGDDPEEMPRLEPELNPDRWTLIEEMRVRSPPPSRSAYSPGRTAWNLRGEGLTLYRTRVIKAPRGRLFKVKHREVQVSLRAITKKDEPWDEPTRQLVQDLDEIGVRLGKRNRPRAALEILDDERTLAEFLDLMERHLEAVTG